MTTETAAELRAFFETYARHFTDALEGRPDFEAMAAQYTSVFLGAGPQGVSVASNDEAFVEVLRQGFEHYRAIGTKRMAVRDVEVTPIDEMHAMAKVSYRASYVRPRDHEPIDIDFEVTYLAQDRDGWHVFAFVAGDEQALYEEHDLRPADG